MAGRDLRRGWSRPECRLQRSVRVHQTAGEGRKVVRSKAQCAGLATPARAGPKVEAV